MPVAVYNTQLPSELEVPVSTSESKGHAQIKVMSDGTIESVVIINNKGDETIRFGPIHHLNPGAPTGPVIWWLTAPTGVNLGITDRHVDIRQNGAFVSKRILPLTRRRSRSCCGDPASFYVNFHSNACPGGCARVPSLSRASAFSLELGCRHYSGA